MSEQRLSKLQKWILKYLYNHDDYKITVQVLKHYGCKEGRIFNPEAKRNAIEVTFSRSLRSLYHKDLIEANTSNPGAMPSGRVCGRKKNFADEGNIKWLYLTDEGEAKAKELLNVKNGELNNKESEVK